MICTRLRNRHVSVLINRHERSTHNEQAILFRQSGATRRIIRREIWNKLRNGRECFSTEFMMIVTKP